jgi:hypothetical protein
VQLLTLISTAISKGSQSTGSDLGLQASAKELYNGLTVAVLAAADELGRPVGRSKGNPHYRALSSNSFRYAEP